MRPSVVFRLDRTSGVPPYLQIVHQVEHAIQLGYLRLGDQLPTVKDAVEALSINPNTVVKAYRELEHKGLVAGRPGQGTFVRARGEPIPPQAIERLKRSMMRWLTEAAKVGLDASATSALFNSALRDGIAPIRRTP